MGLKVRLDPERVAAAILVCVAVWFLWNSLRLNYRSEFGRPGPGFLPVWTSLGLLIIAALWLMRCLRGCTPERTPSDASSRRRVRPFSMVVLVAATIALVERLGFWVTAAVFLVAVFRYVEGLRWRRTVALAILGSTCAYLVFDRVLGVQLPRGLWGGQ